MTSFNLAASVVASMHDRKSGAGTSRPRRSLPCPRCFKQCDNLSVHVRFERDACQARIDARNDSMSRHPSTRPRTATTSEVQP